MDTLHFCTSQTEDEPLVSIPIPIQIQTEKSQQQMRKNSRQFISIESVDESAVPSDTETELAVDKV